MFYVHTPAGLVAQVEEIEGETSRTTRYFHDDGLRSVSLITNATGSVVHARQWFGPFGQRLALDATDAPPEVSTVVRGFTEHRQEDSLGLIDMRGRFYDPRLRQFLSPDPLTADPLSSQGTNPYSYVMNHAPNAWDPSGFDGEEWSEEGFHQGSCDDTGCRSSNVEYPATPGADRADAFQSLPGHGTTSPVATAVPSASASVGGDSRSEGALLSAFRSVAGDRAADIAGAFYNRLFSVATVWSWSLGVLFGALQEVPILNVIVDGTLFGFFAAYLYNHGRELVEAAFRFGSGTDTRSDREALGSALADFLTFSAGSARGRQAVGSAVDGAVMRMAGPRVGLRWLDPTRAARLIPRFLQQVERIRSRIGRSDGNVAILVGEIGGRTIHLEASSGSRIRPGMVGLPSSPRFSPYRTRSSVDRGTDAERILLENAANMIQPGETGWLLLFSENTMCGSCYNESEAIPGVAQQFANMFGDRVSLTLSTPRGRP